MTAEVAERSRQHLLRADGQEDVALGLYSISSGRDRTTLILQSLVLPQPNERRVHGNASFSSGYILRAAAHAAKAGRGLVMLHSHPAGRGWQWLSTTDHTTEQGAAHIGVEYTGHPLLGMTLGGADTTWSARLWQHGESPPLWVESVRVVGPVLAVSWNDELRPAAVPTASQVRTVAAWGPTCHANMTRLRTLVVGVGSVGLDVAQRLAATGITDIGVMDPDVVEELNLDRMIGATRGDARRRRHKVDVAMRTMRAAATAAWPRFRSFPISICTPEGLAHALDYDVIFSCVDRPWPRAVLNGIAYADLIPVIDGGLALQTFDDQTMRSGSWRAHTLVPGRPCMACIHQIEPTEVMLDQQGLLDAPDYIEQTGRTPSVGGAPNVAAYSASLSAALLAQFINLAAQPGGQGIPPPLRYLLASHDLHRLEFTSGKHCPYEAGIALGDDRAPLTAAGPQATEERRSRCWRHALAHRIAGVLRSSADKLD
ncbi:ThiF family adenylyltransferase [Mycobacterium simiae]|nr:ThiF family adenylyltransferase [Mycobacterium simiae]